VQRRNDKRTGFLQKSVEVSDKQHPFIAERKKVIFNKEVLFFSGWMEEKFVKLIYTERKEVLFNK
jgi:hypothetical protein